MNQIKKFTENWKTGGAPRRGSNDSDSLTLILSPWQRRRKPPILTEIQTGRTVTAPGFYLCYASVMLLSLGIGLICISIWSIVFKIPYTYLVDCSAELAYFVLPAAALCFPCFWIALSVHGDEKSHRLLPLLIMLLIFSIMRMVTGTYIGFTHRLRMKLNPKVSPEINENLRKEFNDSMRSSMVLYNVNKDFKKAWDQIQQRLECCGIDNSSDWLAVVNGIPRSCCKDEVCSQNRTESTGCLDLVILDLAWQTSLFGGLSCVALLMQICTLIAVTSIYFVDKWKNK